jgi:hypothetical protein
MIELEKIKHDLENSLLIIKNMQYEKSWLGRKTRKPGK